MAAVISGGDGPAEILDFRTERKDWLKRFVDFPAGIPCHDTVGRILSIIKPAEFQKALLAWLTELRRGSNNDAAAAGVSFCYGSAS